MKGNKEMPFDRASPEMRFATAAVVSACRLAQRGQAELAMLSAEKEDRSPVTVADLGIQALVGHMLERTFPTDSLVAEESSSTLRAPDGSSMLLQVAAHVQRFIPSATAEDICKWIDHGTSQPTRRFWVLDPVDGTKGFLRGDPFAVALALIEDGNVRIGLLGCPNLTMNEISRDKGVLFAAMKGRGTVASSLLHPNDSRKVHVSSVKSPGHARILRSFEDSHTDTSSTESLARTLCMNGQPVLMDSQAKYCLLAAGSAEIMTRFLSRAQPDYKEQIWDQAAGSIILEEAGGVITDLRGMKLDFKAGRTLANNTGILATNGHLHQAVLDAIVTSW